VDARADALARLFEAVHEGVFIGTLGPHRNETVAANAHLKTMLGFPGVLPEGDFAPLSIERFVDPLARQALLDRLLVDKAVANYLVRLRRADQTPIWVELTARADPSPESDTARVEALFRDVSERKRLDDETRALYHQLLQAEKMSALGQTISGVAHELNNPLATILSWSERLAQKPGADVAIKRGLEIIHGESLRAARIVRNLLMFARKRQTTRALVDINQIVRETLALRAHEQLVGNVRFIDGLASGLPPLFADAHQLQQVLLNLVINAEQAMLGAHGGGVLVVRTWHDADREAILLEVNDDGPGMAEDVQARVFEPFFTTKQAGGTGLGLTVAYAIVQEHGGHVRVESTPKGGASFFVELPVSGARRPATQAVSATPLASGGSVLLVEDEAPLASAVADALADAGYTVEVAGNGEEALVKVSAHTFDVVVCDLKMPRLDGRAFYQRLAATWPTLAQRVIFVTGDVAGTDAEEFLELSGRPWLAKPFRLGELLQAVGDALAR
jgi:signal transduction histidine kinase